MHEVFVKNITHHLLLMMVFCSTIVCAKWDEYTTAGPALTAVYDHLMSAVYSCELDDTLVLEPVFAACDLLRNGEIEIHGNDTIIIDDIIALINIRLMRNPTLIKFLKNLDASVEPWQRLSENEFATILKNSALLVSVDEIFTFAEILKTVTGRRDTAVPVKHLNALLKSVELNSSTTPLQLWERRAHLGRLYELLQYRADTIAEKISYAKKSARVQKNIETLFAALGITDEYVVALQRVEQGGGYAQGKLYELFEDAFCGEPATVTISAYARYIEKCVRQNEKIFGRHVKKILC